MIKKEVKNIKEKPRCSKCNSTQIRTTYKFRICNRCGFKEKLDGNN